MGNDGKDTNGVCGRNNDERRIEWNGHYHKNKQVESTNQRFSELRGGINLECRKSLLRFADRKVERVGKIKHGETKNEMNEGRAEKRVMLTL